MSGGLPGFLRDRWAEDEERAREAIARTTTTKRWVGGRWVVFAAQPAPWSRSAWPPERVLAEVDAKLHILDEVVPMIDDASNGLDREHGRVPDTRYLSVESKALLRALAAPYKDHPDYAQAEAETEQAGLGGWK